MNQCDLCIPSILINRNGEIVRANLFSTPVEGLLLDRKDDDLLDEYNSFVVRMNVDGVVHEVEVYKFFDSEDWYHDRKDCSDIIIIFNNISVGTANEYRPIKEFLKNHEVFGGC